MLLGNFQKTLNGQKYFATGPKKVFLDGTKFGKTEAQGNIWLDPTEDPAPHRAWTANLWEKIRGEGSGAYVNFLEREGEARIHEAYPGDTYERLVTVKTAYDPQNLFQFNQNIKPRG